MDEETREAFLEYAMKRAENRDRYYSQLYELKQQMKLPNVGNTVEEFLRQEQTYSQRMEQVELLEFLIKNMNKQIKDIDDALANDE